jgi:hypothetical protein
LVQRHNRDRAQGYGPKIPDELVSEIERRLFFVRNADFDEVNKHIVADLRAQGCPSKKWYYIKPDDLLRLALSLQAQDYFCRRVSAERQFNGY